MPHHISTTSSRSGSTDTPSSSSRKLSTQYSTASTARQMSLSPCCSEHSEQGGGARTGREQDLRRYSVEKNNTDRCLRLRGSIEKDPHEDGEAGVIQTNEISKIRGIKRQDEIQDSDYHELVADMSDKSDSGDQEELAMYWEEEQVSKTSEDKEVYVSDEAVTDTNNELVKQNEDSNEIEEHRHSIENIYR